MMEDKNNLNVLYFISGMSISVSIMSIVLTLMKRKFSKEQGLSEQNSG